MKIQKKENNITNQIMIKCKIKKYNKNKKKIPKKYMNDVENKMKELKPQSEKNTILEHI
jgi:hypothetical protein